MLLALGYPPDSIFRSHLLPLHLESTIPTSPPYAPSSQPRSAPLPPRGSQALSPIE